MLKGVTDLLSLVRSYETYGKVIGQSVRMRTLLTQLFER